MITNIVDNRENEYQFKKVHGILEGTRSDNSCQGADQCNEDGVLYVECGEMMTISELLEWANKHPGHNTLYIRN